MKTTSVFILFLLLLIKWNGYSQNRSGKTGVSLGITSSHLEGVSEEDAHVSQKSITGFRLSLVKELYSWINSSVDYSFQGSHFVGSGSVYTVYFHSIGVSALPTLRFHEVPLSPYIFLGPRLSALVFHSYKGANPSKHDNPTVKTTFNNINGSILMGGGATLSKGRYPVGLEFIFTPFTMRNDVRKILYSKGDHDYADMKMVSYSINWVAYIH